MNIFGASYQVQYKSGSMWYTQSSSGTEQNALIRGEALARLNPTKRYRMVLVENGRKYTVHMF